jgi:HAD superfamily hydrolase (TIGR01509 family)
MPIRTILFDMDGVLIDAREWHYEALNRALGLFGMPISRFDHLSTFDGLPTRKKLEMLTIEKGLPRGIHSLVNTLKQAYTMELVAVRCKPVFQHEYALSRLRAEGFTIGVCSNSIRATVEAMMGRAGLLRYCHLVLSNEDIPNPKPAPDIYLEGMRRAGTPPEETLVVEDNENGIRAARDSGAHVWVVKSPADVCYEAIMAATGRVGSEAGQIW